MDLQDPGTRGIVSGTVTLVIYLACKAYQKEQPELAEGITAFLGGTGVVAGLHLCYLTSQKFPACDSIIADNRNYLFLGGMAIVWTSISQTWQIFKRKAPSVVTSLSHVKQKSDELHA